MSTLVSLAPSAHPFCDHGVPLGSHCRWCLTGTMPEQPSALAEADRSARRAAIRADWQAQLAALANPLPPIAHTCGACGRSYSAAGWIKLPLVGRQDKDADGDQRLELRNCRCGSTRAVDVGVLEKSAASVNCYAVQNAKPANTHETINRRAWEMLRVESVELARGDAPLCTCSVWHMPDPGCPVHGVKVPRRTGEGGDPVPAPATDPAKTLASPGCYSCHGTGKVDGFGADGLRCPCIASCEDCGEDIAWEHDDEHAPSHCATCFATALEGGAS